MTKTREVTNESVPWFGTVNLREGGPWKIYQTTRQLALLQPEALVADFGRISDDYFQQHHIPMRLLAFTLGTTNTTEIRNRTVFEQEYTLLCKALFSGSNESEFCSWFASIDTGIDEVPFYTTQDYIHRNCEARTHNTTKYFFREKIVSYYT